MSPRPNQRADPPEDFALHLLTRELIYRRTLRRRPFDWETDERIA